MKKIVFVMLFSLCFATGFTCSKNTPTAETSTEVKATTPETAQEQMAAPDQSPAPSPSAEPQVQVSPSPSPAL